MISPAPTAVAARPAASLRPSARLMRRPLTAVDSTTHADGVLEAVGQTPTVRLRRLACGRDLRVFAKLEMCNPGGSMKDRPAARMVEQAMMRGDLRAGMTVVESSSGNMAVGLSQACAYHGLKFVCVADVRTQPANVSLMRAYGATVEVLQYPDPETGDFLKARLDRVRQIVADRPDVYWTNQYANADNPAAHTQGTARELLEESGGLDVLLVAVSTTGTLNGAVEACRRWSPKTRVVAMDAAGSVLFGGTAGPRAISGLGAGTVSPLARDARPHDVRRVTDLDCVVGCRALVRREGLLAGGSSGGLVLTLQRMAAELPVGCRVGFILPDHGSRYLETVYDDDWVARVCGRPADDVQTLVEDAVTGFAGEGVTL